MPRATLLFSVCSVAAVEDVVASVAVSAVTLVSVLAFEWTHQCRRYSLTRNMAFEYENTMDKMLVLGRG